MTNDVLLINEVFHSIQGESTWAGLPCTFVRLSGCHLRCGYCDTEYAFHEGERMAVDAVVARVDEIGRGAPLVEVTGGEPLLQPNVHPLMTRLCDAGHTVLLETSGACDISACDSRVIRIMDLKTPGSGEVERNLWENVEHLGRQDEVKFVLSGRADYDWAREVIAKYDLAGRVKAILLSAVHEMPQGVQLPGATGLELRQLAEWLLEDSRLAALRNVRLQTQLHKLIWDPHARGV